MRGALLSMAALLSIASASQAQELTWSGSLGYAAGSYIFTEQFRTFSWLNALTVRGGRLEFTASMPVVAQNGTSVSYVAGIPVPTGGPDNGAVQRRQQGQSVPVRPGRRGQGGQSQSSIGASAARLAGTSFVATAVAEASDSLSVAGTGSYEINAGDPMFGAALSAYEGSGTVRAVGVDAWVKAPLASIESGVGTGAWDYGAGGSLTLGLGEALLFANATWWVLGDMPALELKDALFYSMAVGRSMGRAWSFLASASASTQIIAGSDPPASVGLLLSRRLGSGASLSVSASAGVTESASAFTVGLGWSTLLIGGHR